MASLPSQGQLTTEGTVGHRYALLEILGELPPGWEPHEHGGAYLRATDIGTHYLRDEGPERWHRGIMYLGGARAFAVAQRLQDDVPIFFATPHEGMAAIDTWIEQTGEQARRAARWASAGGV